jgi:D-glycero-D-manno-heptose 1,7-bisphosphate phosphatase
VTDRATFLDRDGVINENWWNPYTKAWEAPMRADDFRLRAGAIAALGLLQRSGFRLFLVSNQPNVAKGKCTMGDLDAVHARLLECLSAGGIAFSGFYYAYGHPEPVVPEFAHIHDRKPSAYFLERAIDAYKLDRGRSWMVGDRDTDIECGKRAGVRTIKVRSAEPAAAAPAFDPDFEVDDLGAAASLIVSRGQ